MINVSEELKKNPGADDYTCPYCDSKLKKWSSPPDSTWAVEYQYVCFNDDCPYFVRGWQWMEEKYKATASYRHRFNPFTGEKGPLPVWSQNALKENIIEEDE